MKKYIIIGSKGYIGHHLKWYLQQMGIDPICYDINEEGGYKVDTTDYISVSKIDFNVDYIFMFAGLTGTFAGFDSYGKYIDINEKSLLNLLEAIRCSSYRPKIIFPSSRLVYKGTDKALKEEDEKETKTIYAVNKLACEGYLYAYNKSFDIPFTVFRICVPYGNLLNRSYSFGTLGFFIKMASAKKDITLYGGGHFKRTFTSMEDLCYQIINAGIKKESNCEVYNIGGETYSLNEVASLVAKKYKVNIVDIPWPDKDLRIESGHTYFDDSKIQDILHGYNYKHLQDLI